MTEEMAGQCESGSTSTELMACLQTQNVPVWTQHKQHARCYGLSNNETLLRTAFLLRHLPCIACATCEH
eukprot:5378459-Alexandrium_andersonii.AAC.1